ncbi:hypothetical protein Pelo_14844 [Pelomyxa schiedti]|nr:hypothetical protein Pelo_14844 [Pelomyxa schiedti]
MATRDRGQGGAVPPRPKRARVAQGEGVARKEPQASGRGTANTGGGGRKSTRHNEAAVGAGRGGRRNPKGDDGNKEVLVDEFGRDMTGRQDSDSESDCSGTKAPHTRKLRDGIPGYDNMTPAQRVKEKMQLQLCKVSAFDSTLLHQQKASTLGEGKVADGPRNNTSKETSEDATTPNVKSSDRGWERFDLNSNAPLDERPHVNDTLLDAEDDFELPSKLHGTHGIPTLTAAELSHEDAIFGPVSTHILASKMAAVKAQPPSCTQLPPGCKPPPSRVLRRQILEQYDEAAQSTTPNTSTIIPGKPDSSKSASSTPAPSSSPATNSSETLDLLLPCNLGTKNLVAQQNVVNESVLTSQKNRSANWLTKIQAARTAKTTAQATPSTTQSNPLTGLCGE